MCTRGSQSSNMQQSLNAPRDPAASCWLTGLDVISRLQCIWLHKMIQIIYTFDVNGSLNAESMLLSRFGPNVDVK